MSGCEQHGGPKRCEELGCDDLHANGCSADESLRGWKCLKHLTTNVVQVEFRVGLDDGRTAEVIFVRKEKLVSLMHDEGNLGDFLRSIVDSMPKKKEGH